MIARRLIRVLTVYSKTTFFVDKGTQLGMVPDAFKLFEDELNKRLKNKNVIVHVVIVPVAADELIPALVDGRGDIVSAGKLATAWRRERVDFTNATRKGISSIVVTGPGVPPLKSLDDLAGKEVYVRASDVSAKNVDEFNARLAAAGKPPVRIKPAPEVLADEDLLEMVNAGLVPMTVVDDYIAEFWKQIFPEPGPQHVVRGSDRRRNGDDGPQGQPEADGGNECVPGPVSGRIAAAERVVPEVPEEREIRQERDIGSPTASGSGRRSRSCASTATSTNSTTSSWRRRATRSPASIRTRRARSARSA